MLPRWTFLTLLPLLFQSINGQFNVHNIIRQLKIDEQSLEHVQNVDYSHLKLEHLLPGAALDISPFKTRECRNDLESLQNSMTKIVNSLTQSENIELDQFDREVTMEALDASGKVGPGILHGHRFFYGLLSECQDIDYKMENSSRHWQGDYYRIYFDISNSSCKSTVGLDVCLPKSCSSEEINNVIGSVKGPLPICDVKNINDGRVKTSAGTYIVGTIMIIIIALCIISGVYDYFLYDYVRDLPVTNGIGHRLFMSFSFYRNVSEIFTTSNSKKPGQIAPIHCIRFFSMSWVIMGHMMGFLMAFSANPVDVIQETKHTEFEFLTNAYFSVDSFFFMGGLLLSFIWFKDFKKNKHAAMSPLAWVMFYVHRIIRLSPPYYLVIGFYTWIFLPYMKNSLLTLQSSTPDPCGENWWINLLYLNNFIRYKDQCYLVSWYLSTDLQMYLFTPLLLIPLALNMSLGLLVSLFLFSLSTAANIFSVYHYYFPPSDYPMGDLDPRMLGKTDFDHYTLLMYDAPWIRCQIYIMGMLVGYLLQMKKTMKINKYINFFLFIVSGVLMLTVALGLHKWTNHTEMPLFWRAMYSAFSRPAWGLGLSWIVISCYYGHGGPINQFMSWNIWVPLGRLTYCAYLTHVIVLSYFMTGNKSEIFYSGIIETWMSFILPCIVMAYLFAIFWSSCFEISLGKVESILIGSLRGRPSIEKKQNTAPVTSKEFVTENGGKEQNWT